MMRPPQSGRTRIDVPEVPARWRRTGCLSLIGGALLLLAAIFGIAGWNTVDSGKVGVTRRFGEITGTKQAGGFWQLPIGFSMVEYDLRVAKTLQNQQTALKNQQTLFIKQTAYQYNLTPQAAQRLLETVGTQDTFEANVVIPKLENAMKKVTPQYTAEQVFPERTQMEIQMEKSLASDLQKYEVDPGSVDITLADMDFDPAFRQTIDAKAKAQQEQQVEQANLEKQKVRNQQELQQARTDADKAKLAAQGEANAAEERARGEAQSIRLRAGAQAEGNTMVRQSLNRDLIDYEYARNWNGQLPSTVLGGGGSTSTLIGLPGTSSPASTPTATPTATPTPSPAPTAAPTQRP